MSELSFSVVIPTYNRADLIQATLRTVFAQTYPHYEVIVVDNCSTDNTAEVLAPYVREGRLRLIQHERNYERARSRNTGMEAARGDFVTFLDSDDYMYERNLADAAEYARAHPELKCFHNLYEIVNQQGEVIYRPKYPPLDDQIKAIVYGNFMSCIGNFIHREIYRQYRFDTEPTLTGGEDWDFWLRVLAKYKVGRIERVNSGVLQHGGRSINRQGMARMQAGLEYLVGKLARDPELAAVYGPHLKRIAANSFIYLATLANTGQQHATALGYLRKALSKDLSAVTTPRFIRVLQIALLRMDIQRA